MSQTNFEEANTQLTNTQIHNWQIHKYTIDKYMIDSPVDKTFTIGRLGHPAIRKTCLLDRFRNTNTNTVKGQSYEWKC